MRCIAFLILIFINFISVAQANEQDKALQAVHLLQYIAVDYPAAVVNGAIIDEGEYLEMQEFAARVQSVVAQLNEMNTAQFKGQAAELSQAIINKQPVGEVANLATELNQALIHQYQIAVAPQRLANIEQSKHLFAEQCALCHGATGAGDGSAGKMLNPAPSNFHEEALIESISLFAMYNTISQGVEGTAMTPFDSLSESERWGLAFYAGQLFANAELQEAGKRAWQAHPEWHDFSLEDLSNKTISELRAVFSTQTKAVVAYLRAHPDVLEINKENAWAMTKRLVNKSLSLYEAGQSGPAYDMAITSYLEGFEPLEPVIDAYSVNMRKQLETKFLAWRAELKAAAPQAQVKKHHAELISNLTTVEGKITGNQLTLGSLFLSALLILLREGLEIILVLAMMYTVLYRAERKEAVPYVHAGWIVALLAGVATWFVSNCFFVINGESREMTEAITGLLAAVILLYVGFWMHRQAAGQHWQKLIKKHLNAGLTQRSLMTLSFLAFIAVYRELFEIILFYEVLLAQAVSNLAQQAVLFGALSAVVLLLVLIWAMIKLGLRLPIAQFFKASGSVIVILAVMFIGHSFHAFAEVGYVPTWPINLPEMSVLGIYADVYSLTVQFMILISFLLYRRYIEAGQQSD